MDQLIKKISEFELDVKYQYNKTDYLEILRLFHSMNSEPPDNYVGFIKEVGAVYIKSEVMVRSESTISDVGDDDNLISIGRFLDWSKKSDFSIWKIISMYSEQLPDNFIPFAEGASGDFYGFSIRKNNEYFISYWYHESLINQQIFKVADDFKDFIMSINSERKNSLANNKSMPEKHTTPPKMMELLKKTGKWKGD